MRSRKTERKTRRTGKQQVRLQVLSQNPRSRKTQRETERLTTTEIKKRSIRTSILEEKKRRCINKQQGQQGASHEGDTELLRQGCNTHYQFIEDRKKRDKEQLRIKGMDQNIKNKQKRRQKYEKANSSSQHFSLKTMHHPCLLSNSTFRKKN